MDIGFRMIATILMAIASLAVDFVALPTSAFAGDEHFGLGFEQVTIPDPDHVPLAAIIWYPTNAEGREVQIGPIAIKAAPGAPLARSDLPLIVISHGTGAGAISHIDTAIALAEAGFIVVSPTHNGDNYEDDSDVGKPAWFENRSRHIVRAIDFMLDKWRGTNTIDKKDIGVFGFSAGATTALIAIGGEPDLGLLAPHCAAKPEIVCRLFPSTDTMGDSSKWSHDPRISAAAIAAPGLGFLFGPNALAKVNAPVQVWAGSNDDIVPYATNTANIRSLLPVDVEYHQIEGASHLSFLAPCPDPSIMPAICSDRPGFDRAAFHAVFNAALIEFFSRNLNTH